MHKYNTFNSIFHKISTRFKINCPPMPQTTDKILFLRREKDFCHTRLRGIGFRHHWNIYSVAADYSIAAARRRALLQGLAEALRMADKPPAPGRIHPQFPRISSYSPEGKSRLSFICLAHHRILYFQGCCRVVVGTAFARTTCRGHNLAYSLVCNPKTRKIEPNRLF